MLFTKKDKQAHRDIVQPIIDRVTLLYSKLQTVDIADPTLTPVIENIIFPPEVCFQLSTCCNKLRKAGLETTEKNCIEQGCPMAPRCHEFVADMWRGGRAILFLLGKGGYKSNDSRLGRCRECILFEACEKVEGVEKIRYCAEMMYRKGLEAQEFINSNLV